MPDGKLENAHLSAINFWEQLGTAAPPAGHWADLRARWHPEDRDRVEHAIRAYLHGQTKEYEVVARIVQSDGTFRTRLARGIALRDAEGMATRFIGSSVDITDRGKVEDVLRESEERFRSTFENAAAGILHLDFETLQLTRVNQRFCEMTGFTREELLGRSASALTHADDQPASVKRLAALARGEFTFYAVELRVVRRDGGSIPMEITVSSVTTPGTRPYAVVIAQDLSRRKHLEEELRQAKEVAEAGSRAKDEFLANVSHEIRTPMNAILGMTELVLDTALSEEQRRSLKTVKSAASSLLGVINDLLDFSKIEAGKVALDVAPFSLRATLGDTMHALAMRAHRQGLELISSVHPSVPDTLVGDPGRLRQILVNLVGNAIKFTASGEVEVRIGPRAPEPGRPGVAVDFEVRDTGIGIPPEKQAMIFRAFEQEDMSTTRKYGGTGLGLTIAAQLVAMMGGQIALESDPGKGSTFRFTAFMARPGGSEVASFEVPLDPAFVGLPVLVVDDNASSRRVLEESLRAWRMKPVGVADEAAAAVAVARAVASGNSFGLVLLDTRMPGTDAAALAAKLRDLPGARVVLLTSGDEQLDRFRALGIDWHVLKPAPEEELRETIRAAMRPRQPAVVAGRPWSLQTPIAAAGAAPLRVLVAEDNALNAELLQLLLSRRGHRVQVASDGRDALAHVEGGRFDLLLLDLHMPELDGFQVIRRLREGESSRGGAGRGGKRLPVVALTARSRPEDHARCLEAGMDDFLVKPVQATLLWDVIHRLTSRTKGEEAQGLISSGVLLAACGGDALILGKIADALRAALPRDLAKVEQAFEDRDAPCLREAAHALSGMVSAFSTSIGHITSELEAYAARGQLGEAGALIGRLRAITPDLIRQVGEASIESLRRDLGSR
jgi:PAS domain S-box-containing protein